MSGALGIIKKKVLFIGDPAVDIRHYKEDYEKFKDKFEVVVREEQDKESWVKALKDEKYVEVCQLGAY